MTRFVTGTTDQYIYFVAVDATDLVTRETGLSSFTVYRARNGGTATAYTTPTVAEVSAANMPGVYSLLLDEDMTIGTGNKSEEVVLHITQASMAPVTLTYELYRPDVTDGETITTAGGIAQANVVQAAGVAWASGAIVRDAFGSDTGLRTVRSSTMQSGSTSTTAVLDASASATDDLYNYLVLQIRGGTGAGQSRVITDYVGSTKTATVSPAWAVTPDNTSTYSITPMAAVDNATVADAVWDEDATGHQTQGTFGQAIGDPGADTDTIHGILNAAWGGSSLKADIQEIRGSSSAAVAYFNEMNTADSGTTTTLTDASLTETDTDYWKGSIVLFRSGSIAGQARLITGFDPATDTLTFSPAVTQAVTTHTYMILPGPGITTDAIADAVWDEDKTDHLIASTMGQQLRFASDAAYYSDLLKVSTGTASAGAASSITLAGASATDDIYVGALVNVYGGTGAGQVRRITDYDGTTEVATVSPAWTVTPDNTSTFVVWADTGDAAAIADYTWNYSLAGWSGTGDGTGDIMTRIEEVASIRRKTAQAGSSTTITLDASASSTDDVYNDSLICIVSGTGAEQVRRITDYNGTTKVATIQTAWVTNPDSSSVFAILPYNAMASDVLRWKGTLVSTPTTGGVPQVEVVDVSSAGQSDIKSTVVEALATDTYAEPGQGTPAATTTLAAKINYIYKALRNKVTQTSTTFSLFADDGTTVDQKATVSDDGTTFTRTELISGP